MDGDDPLSPFRLKAGALHWFLPALLSAALIPSSHLGASAQEAAPPDGQAQTANGAMPTPARGLVPGPGRPVGDAAGLGPDVLGRGAVRRTFTAPADGWYRLAARGGHARWAVTVPGGGPRGVLASSRWEDAPGGGALVHARAGAGLPVLVGALEGPFGGFELEWTGAPAPVRLRPAGRLSDGGRDALGVPVEMRRPGDLAHGAGRLFMASGLGLSAYSRDPATGGLALERVVDADVSGALLAWDGGRSRLLAHDCGRWTAFRVGADGALRPAERVPAVGDPAHCGRPLVGAGGGPVHRVGAHGVDLFSAGPDGGLRYEGTAAVPGLRGAALGVGGEVYAAGADGLVVVSRRDGGSRPSAAPAGIRLAAEPPARVPLAVGAGGGLLLAADAGGARLFALVAGAAPAPLGVLPAAPGVGAAAGCAFAALRPGGVVDALCGGRLATAQWLGEGEAPAGFAAGPALAGVGAAAGMAATPDGRRVYVSAPGDGILAFERVPAQDPDDAADDHGDDPATATPVAIPSTTAGVLGAGDKDYFRIDITRAGILTFETTGSTDTYGTLYDGDGTVLDEDDDRGPRPTNFRIADALLFEGTYFLEVREMRGVTGAYELRVTGDARGPGTPAATAPSVSINSIPSGNEGTDVRLGATLTGGAYDGAVGYSWSVDGGTLDDGSAAAPTWTRPSVTSNANRTVRLTVTVRGAGTNAEDGTSDTASGSREALVRDVPTPLPTAAAPSVSISAIPDGDENTNVRLGATLNGGTYDGAVSYQWSVDGGVLDNANAAAPTWTRPSVTSNTNYTVRLTVTARGSGTNARSGTSDTASASRTAQVRNVAAPPPAAAAPSVSIDAIPAGDEGTDVRLGAALAGGTYDGAASYQWSVDGGALDNANAGAPTWTRPSVASNANHTVRLTVTVRGSGTAARSDTSDTASASRTTQVRNVAAPLPAAAAPSVSIGAIPAGDEGTDVRLGATLTGGAYDGAAQYLWSVDGGALDNANAAAPTWTRPAVASDTNHSVRLRVTVRGSGTAARNGTSDSATASRPALVRNVAGSLPAADAPSLTINTIPAGDEDATVQLNATLSGGTYDGRAEYQWTVDGGTLDDPTEAAPVWTRPTVTGTVEQVASLTVTVRGTGAAARSGSSDTVSASRSAQVRNVNGNGQFRDDHGINRSLATWIPIPSTFSARLDFRDRDFFRIDVGQVGTLRARTQGSTDTYGTLYDIDGQVIVEDDDSGAGRNFRLSASSVAAGIYYLEVRGADMPLDRGPYSLEVSGTARGPGPMPAAVAPSVSINAIPPGDEGATVQLGAALSGGTYDGSVEYAWSVDGGTLDDAGSATPTWTRPTVTGTVEHVASLTVTVRGTGTTVRGGSSDSASASRSAQVRNVVGRGQFRDDHGRERESATWLPIPSTLSAELEYRDRDFFRIEVGQAGTLRLETKGSTDTYGTLRCHSACRSGSDTTLVAQDDDSGAGRNFRISASSVAVGIYYLEVRGDDMFVDRGNYSLEVSGTARGPGTLPAATAPAVSIEAIPTGEQGTSVQFAATLTGGTYDGALEYAWSVDGAALDDASATSPTWTRPTVNTEGTYTVRLTVTARGAGTNARSGSSDAASASQSAGVRQVQPQLPLADAPAASINAIPSGRQGTTVRLGASLSGGTYDGTPEYAWTADGGTFDDPNSAAPTWTRPAVDANTDVVVRLRITAHGSGMTARNGTSDSVNASRSAQVRNAGGDDHGGDQASATVIEIPSDTAGTLGAGDRDWFRIAIGQAGTLRLETTGGTDTYGTLYRSDGSKVVENDDSGHFRNFRISRGAVPVGTYYLEVRGYNASIRGSYVLKVSGTARSPATLPAAVAPSVTINTVPAGDENTTVQLGATLTNGTYDGAAEYDWSVNGGRLDNANSATPTWTRPSVTSDTNYTVRLEVTVHGTGTNASNGTSDSASASKVAQVRDVPPQLAVAAAPTVSINAIAAGDENTSVQLGAALNGGNYDGAPSYTWSVSGGSLNNTGVASPTWTRPAVAANTNHTVSLTVTVGGTGAVARSGTSDSANTSRDALVRNVTAALPVAAAPSVTIDSIASGTEGTSVQLSAMLTGGTYDGALDYAWTVDGGTLDDPNAATPTWTRPSVNANADHIVRLTVTARGSGTTTRSGTSDTASASRTAQVRDGAGEDHGNDRASATVVEIPSTTTGELTPGDRDWFRIDIVQAGTLRLQTSSSIDTLGTLHRADGTTIDSNDDGGHRYNFRITTRSLRAGTYYLEVRGFGSGTRGPYSLEVSGTAQSPTTLPPAIAPSVSITAIPAGDEHTGVQLGATLADGTYDGAPEYAWSVDGGVLDNAASATPTWTRPAVTANTNHTVRLTVTVRGAGTNADTGTSATMNASHSALVRNVQSALPPASAPAVSIDSIPAGDEGTSVQLGATLNGGTYDSAPQYAWTVDGGTLDDPNAATPTWTRPAVTADINHTVRLTVTVLGTGTAARNNARDAASASQTGLVRDVAQLPVARAPTVSINAAPRGEEGTAVQFSARLSGGTYDGEVEYAWTVHGGTLANADTATPTWTRPMVDQDLSYPVYLTVTVRGSGVRARSGTSATRRAIGSAGVLNDRSGAYLVNIPTIIKREISPAGEMEYFRIDVTQSGNLILKTAGGLDTAGRLYDSSGLRIAHDDDGGDGTNFKMTTRTLDPGVYYLEVRAFYRWATGRYNLAVSGTARGPATPAPTPPSVKMHHIPVGDGGTTLQLGATLTGGSYDGTPEYAWHVTGGTLDYPTSATPTLTRPAVTSNRTHTVGLKVTVRGDGTNHRTATIDSLRKTRDFLVRPVGSPRDDHGDTRLAATTVTMPGTVAAQIERVSDLDYFRFELASATKVVVESTGTINTYGYLRNSNGGPITFDNNSGTGENFKIVRTLQAGEYYVSVGVIQHFGAVYPAAYTLVLKPHAE